MKFLYLRTQYWFDLKAGGSVGHTAGVINALKNRVDLEVVSNDNLIGVNSTIEIVKPVFIPFLPKELSELIYNIKIIAHCKNRKSDLIYQRYNGFSFCGAFLAKKQKKPFVLEFNSSEVWKIKYWKTSRKSFKKLVGIFYVKFVKLPIVVMLEKYNIQSAALIVVVSDALRSTLIEAGIESSKILVNPNGIDEKKYHPVISGDIITDRYNLQDKIVIGFIGTFGQWHGVENIVKAFGELLKKYPEYKNKISLFLIGNGIKMGEVKDDITRYGIENSVILTGLIPQNEGPQYLTVCDILVNATVLNPDGSNFFGSPTKLFEYMAMGKGIVCSNMAQMAEILEHKKNAYMVKPGDIEELLLGMKALIDDENLRKTLGKNARKEVVEKYTWDKHVEKILGRIKDVTS